MKKILTIFDGGHFSEGVFDFLDKIDNSGRILLTAVFLRSIDYAMVWNYPLFLSGYITGLNVGDSLMTENKQRFKILCEQRGIEYRIHENLNTDVLDLLKIETRFADLLVMSGNFYEKDTYYIDPESYLHDTLHESECPVLLLPEIFELPKNNILSYDGTAASVFAIKQFSLLFPEWTDNTTSLVYASISDSSVPDVSYAEELCAHHFSDFIVNKLDFEPKNYFDTWLRDVSNPIVITGSHERSALSELLKKSFMDEIIVESKIPVFIAHK